jgi:hypothetical protein
MYSNKNRCERAAQMGCSQTAHNLATHAHVMTCWKTTFVANSRLPAVAAAEPGIAAANWIRGPLPVIRHAAALPVTMSLPQHCSCCSTPFTCKHVDCCCNPDYRTHCRTLCSVALPAAMTCMHESLQHLHCSSTAAAAQTVCEEAVS